MKEKHEAGLSIWQLSMMAVGSVIGASFFLGSSVAIHSAGPSIIISYILGGALVYYILFALSEMTVNDPGAGSFQVFAQRAYGQMAGFVTGWVYWTGIVLAMSSEATAISILVKNWFPDVSTLLLGSIIIIGVTSVNLLGADRLSKLESILAAVKLITIAAFIVIGVLLILGVIKGNHTGSSIRYSRPAFFTEPFFTNGLKGFLGSLLLVIYSYSGFEVLGLAAAEARDPRKTVPKAIHIVVAILLTLYIISVGVILFLIPTDEIAGDSSPMVAALGRYGFGWIGNILNVVLITAILSTMLASMFGVGRMIRTLASKRFAPAFLDEKTEVPYREIIFSGCAMLLALFAAVLMPEVYLFLVSAGGFSSIFVYIMIMASHIRFRGKHGKPDDKLRLEGFPYSSLFVLICLIAAVVFMPFVKGQTAGLVAGVIIIVFYCVIFIFAVDKS